MQVVIERDDEEVSYSCGVAAACLVDQYLPSVTQSSRLIALYIIIIFYLTFYIHYTYYRFIVYGRYIIYGIKYTPNTIAEGAAAHFDLWAAGLWDGEQI